MLEKYYRLNSVAGINIGIGKEGEVQFNACLLKINGNQLDIDQQLVGLTDINDLKSKIPIGTPVALNLTGRKIQVKQTTLIKDGELDFNVLMPAARPEDFCTQLFSSVDSSFISLIRVDEARKWISQIRNIGLAPLIISLGPFVIEQIIPQLNHYGTDLKFDGNLINRNEQGEWTGYKYMPTMDAGYPFKLENEKIEEGLLLPYAAAFQLALYPKIDLLHAPLSELTDELSKRFDRLKLKVKGTVILVGLFVILLANFLLFSYYNGSNLQLASQVGQTVQLANSAASLTDTLKHNQHLLEEMGWEGKADKSILIDQVAQLLPAGVHWQQVTVDPPGLNPDRSVNQPVFANRKMVVHGVSEQLIPVNEWMARLKTLLWVKNVQLQSYYFNNEINTGQFIIEISY